MPNCAGIPCSSCTLLPAHDHPQAFANDSSNGSKQSADEISRLIGHHIAEAASHMGTMRVWNFNAAVGKYVAQAAEAAKASKLKASSKSSSAVAAGKPSAAPAAKK